MMDPLDQPLAAISAQLAEGTITARTLVEAAQARHDPSLNAYKSWAPDFARRQAAAADAAFAAGNRLGSLQGIPVSVKDIYGVEGLPIFAGSPRELPARWRQEGAVVHRLRRQLAVIMGKSHTVEFAFGGLGVNAHWPVPWNPQDSQVHRSPGGSSSGAGVSLGEGTALVAFGTDTGGSVRIPASVTGTVGVKTTKGRWPTDGIVPLSPTFDTAGTLTRSAADAAFVFESIDGEAVPPLEHLGGVRLAVAEPFFWEGADPGVAERVAEGLRLAAAAGAVQSDLALPGALEVYELYHRGGIVSAELYSFLSCDLPEWIETLDRRVRNRMEAGSALAAWDYLQRRERYAVLGRGAAAALREVDALVCPTVPISPPAMAEITDDDIYHRTNLRMLRNTCVVNFLGLCAVTLPVGRDRAGMPVGMQLIGRPGSEARLLAIAGAFERLLKAKDVWDSPATHALRHGHPLCRAP
jgi:aspartyl-tRNA(Asn)/glutamyl-tRNA(Gln) amidotransferase subunit A